MLKIKHIILFFKNVCKYGKIIMFSRISSVELNLTNTFFFLAKILFYTAWWSWPFFFFYYNTHYFLETKDRNAKNLIHTNLNHFPPNIVYVKHNASTIPLWLKSKLFLLHQRIFCTPPWNQCSLSEILFYC